MKKFLSIVLFSLLISGAVFAQEEKTTDDADFIFYLTVEGGYSMLNQTQCRGGDVTLVAGVQPFLFLGVPELSELAIEFELAIINLDNLGKKLTTVTPIFGVFYFLGFGESFWTLDFGLWFGWSFWPGAQKPSNLPSLPGFSTLFKFGPSFNITDNFALALYYQLNFNPGTDYMLGIDTSGGAHAIESFMLGIRYKFPLYVF